ncbi:MAG: hypothetical protein J6U22_07465, partial [Bacteroidaceae bacterium]|nr:hypothetical protein [Bacteroidaceae bacterium]
MKNVGSYTVTIEGIGNYSGSVEKTFTITPATATVTITGQNNTMAYDGAEHTVSGYDVSIDNTIYTTSDFTFNGTATATQINVGTTNMGLTASQFANTNNNFENVTFNVTDGYQTITPKPFADNSGFTVELNQLSATYDGNDKTPAITVKDGETTLDNSNYSISWANVGGAPVTELVDAGTYTATIASTSGNYSGSLTADFTINKASATVTTGSSSKPYDGTALTIDEASISGLVNGETANVTATGSVTEVGSEDNTYSIEWGTANRDNYFLIEELGTLTVTLNDTEVTLTAASDSKTYDGTALTNSTVTSTGLPVGFTVEATASGSQTNAGSSANVVNDGYVIKNEDGQDKTANFNNIIKVDGTLIVNPKPLTVTATSGLGKVYGDADPELTYTSVGLLEGDSFSGALSRAEGNGVGTYAIAQGTLTAGDNYSIS